MFLTSRRGIEKKMLKKLYTRIFPASKYQIKMQTETFQKSLKQMEKSNEKLLEKFVKALTVSSEKEYMDLDESLTEIKATLDRQNDLIMHLQHQIEEIRKDNKIQLEEIMKMSSCSRDEYKEITKMQRNILGFTQENNWAFVFNNTVAESEWLSKKSFSLGRWAIGYQCSYVLYRVLDEVKPKHILELGLGQSTKFIGQYSDYYKEVQHTVVESDPQWIDFFTHENPLSGNTNVLQCEYAMEDFQGHSNIRVFKGLNEKIKNKKYDLIVIDAPFSGDMNELARIDILKNIPQCLEESFVIIFDDINRLGERNSFNAIRRILDDNNIAYAVGSYHGQNITGVIVSDDLKYIRSM